MRLIDADEFIKKKIQTIICVAWNARTLMVARFNVSFWTAMNL